MCLLVYLHLLELFKAADAAYVNFGLQKVQGRTFFPCHGIYMKKVFVKIAQIRLLFWRGRNKRPQKNLSVLDKLAERDSLLRNMLLWTKCCFRLEENVYSKLISRQIIEIRFTACAHERFYTIWKIIMVNNLRDIYALVKKCRERYDWINQ